MSKENDLFLWVSRWIFSICALVLLMVVIGGVTRLTGSGLSIVEWQPLMGAIPPLNHEDWLEVFYKYQQSPQYQLVNRGMSLEQFQWIFFWEYFHRLVGRLIGVVVVLPMVYFWFRGVLNRTWVYKLCGGLVLGGLQGVMGWLMVASGLINEPQVSHFRLAAHLILALLIFVYFLRLGFQWNLQSPLFKNDPSHDPAKDNLKNDVSEPPSKYQIKDFTKNLSIPFLASLKMAMNIFIIISWLQIFYGALVAGLRAGYMMTTFPLMGQSFFPSGAFYYQPLWTNYFTNPLMVQWIHRMFGWILFFGIWTIWFKVRKHLGHENKKLLNHILFSINLQFALGVITILTSVFMPMAVLHQIFAFVLITTLYWNKWVIEEQLKYVQAQTHFESVKTLRQTTQKNFAH